MPTPPPSSAVSEPSETQLFMRADAVASRKRILQAAATLAGDRGVSMAEIAAAAGVGRSTLYRHFPTRRALSEALTAGEAHELGSSSGESRPQIGQVTTMPYQAAGQLGRDQPLALEVTRVLDEVPPHLVPDQLVAEARRAGGVPVALYVVDIDGSHLLRLAGSPEFPERIDEPPALGPEIVPEGLPDFYEHLQRELPGCVAEPLWLRGRVTGLLLCIGAPVASLSDIARQGAAALELANDYTDFIEAARRHKPTTPAAEIQQNLFPPRIARIAGAQLAGVLLPSYEVGGDWFDFVENRDGAWLAIADAAGTGPTAAGLGAAALGALRAARRDGSDLPAGPVAHARHRAQARQRRLLRDRPHRPLARRDDEAHAGSTAATRRRTSSTSTATWRSSTGHEHPALGVGAKEPSFQCSERRLHSGERIVLVTDGITGRHMEGGGTFGLDGLRNAIENAAAPTAACTAMAIQQAVTDCWREPLEDDGTVVVCEHAR